MTGDVAEPVPQMVLSPLTSAALFLVATIDSGGETIVRELLSDIGSLERSVGFRAQPDGRLSCVTGIGSHAWDRLFSGARPARLHPFREVNGPVHRAVATPGDLLFHIRASRLDLCFALATEIMSRLRQAVTVQDEVHGFKYFDERDLLGFVDGTENPTGPAAHAAVVVGEEDPSFSGGSYVVVQKYLHDLDAWEDLSVEAQERAIGRRKLSDVELADNVKPADSHVALTSLTDADGKELRDPTRQHALRRRGACGVRHVFHRLRPHPRGDGEDAGADVPGHGVGAARPHTGLLRAGDRLHVLRAGCGLPGGTSRAADCWGIPDRVGWLVIGMSRPR